MSTGTDPTEDAQRVAMEGLADCRDEDSYDAGEAVWWTMMPTGPPL